MTAAWTLKLSIRMAGRKKSQLNIGLENMGLEN